MCIWYFLNKLLNHDHQNDFFFTKNVNGVQDISGVHVKQYVDVKYRVPNFSLLRTLLPCVGDGPSPYASNELTKLFSVEYTLSERTFLQILR